MRKELIDNVSIYDNTLLEKYFNPENITQEDIHEAIHRSGISLKIVPLIGILAIKNKGVQPLLDAVYTYLPWPFDLPLIKGINTDMNEEIEREPEDSEPFTELAFNITTNPFFKNLFSQVS